MNIVSKVQVEGFHSWPGAFDEVAFLRERHRHIFVIRAIAPVYHDDRDKEFILFGRQVKQYLAEQYGEPCEFGAMSCEMIATELIRTFELTACEVFEDDENGAIVTKEDIS